MEVVKHETCQEYFRRRLSEGWKRVSLEGYKAVLLSPEGIRRELDLRNDVETLRPNAAGDETNIANQVPDEDEHWDKVDEAEADDGTTHVWSVYGGAGQRDLYNLPASSGSGDINKITVYFRCGDDDFGGPKAWACIKSNSTVTVGDEETIIDGWNTFSMEWAVNPADSEAWEWADIDALQIGVALAGGAMVYSRCTQVYVEVDYMPPVPVADGDLIGIAIIKRS